MGRIHSVENFGTLDGPGVRFVVFMQGCPMRCKYCHNPDTWAYNGGKEVSIDSLLCEINKYKHYFGNNGGVTVSGGEPLLQIDFITDLFKRLKAKNIHTCLDTSGITFDKNSAKFDELIKYTDLVLLDIKHIDREQHKLLTGHYNDNILAFAQYLDKHNIPVWIRHVLVPTVTALKQPLEQLKQFVDGLKNVEKVEILPYHTLGLHKYEKLGLEYSLKGVKPPSKEEIEMANKILQKGR